MKYIIFKDEKTGLIQPVIFGEHTTHSQVTIEGSKPVSAGFCHISSKGGLSITGDSESLGLKPDDTDGVYLSMMLCNAGTSFFIDYEQIEVKEK